MQAWGRRAGCGVSGPRQANSIHRGRSSASRRPGRRRYPPRPQERADRRRRMDPMPSVGGRVLGRSAGPRDNTALEARDDVPTFTTPPLRNRSRCRAARRRACSSSPTTRTPTSSCGCATSARRGSPSTSPTAWSGSIRRRGGAGQGGASGGDDTARHRAPLPRRSPGPTAGLRRRPSAVRAQPDPPASRWVRPRTGADQTPDLPRGRGAVVPHPAAGLIDLGTSRQIDHRRPSGPSRAGRLSRLPHRARSAS